MLYIYTYMLYIFHVTGGYMFPIRGLVVKQDHTSPWVVYQQSIENGRETYDIKGAFPPYPTPDRTDISNMFF